VAVIRPYAPLAAPTQPARPAEAAVARAAQRAFFQAALNGAAPTAAVEPARAAARVTTNTALSEEPTRLLRPGSLVDIRV